MEFQKILNERLEAATKAIEKYAILPVDGFQSTVLDAMNYSILAGGKRLRPIMMLECYKMCGGTDEDVIEPFMAAIEQIHTYSLVHDDLPAMDNDDYRRGKLTTHKAYGEENGILAGDALLNHAFETALKAFEIEVAPINELYQYRRISKALSILAKGAGIYGMIGGQVADVEAEKKALEMDEERMLFIFRLKTGALIKAAMTIGATLAGASDEEVSIIGQAATDVGIAFQIRDDILDVKGNAEILGKPIGSDAKNNKITYVTLNGMDNAQEDVSRYSDSAIAGIVSLPYDTEFMCALIRSLVDRNM